MPLSSSDIPDAKDAPEIRHRRKWKRWRGWLSLFALALLVTLAAIGGQWLSGRQNSMLPGRPLSYPQTHLHTVMYSTRAGVVYLGTHYGLFASTDGGHTWPQKQGELHTSMITSIAVSPDNPDLLAVLAVPTSGLDTHLGVYVSANAGHSWSFTAPQNLPAQAYPYTIQSGSGGQGHFYVFFTYAGWFETLDLGQHWHAITGSSLANLQAPSLLNDPGKPAHLLLGGNSGLFETQNDGQSWQPVANISGNVTSLVAASATRDQARVLFAATDQGLYRWQDGQGTPKLITTLPAASPPTRLVVSADGNELYALCGTDLWFSENQGQSWQRRWHFTRGDLVSLTLNPANPRELLAGFFSPALVLISTNAGSSWSVLTN